MAYCVGRGDRIYLGLRPWVGQAVFCQRCRADLEISDVSPLMLGWTDDLVTQDREEAVGCKPGFVLA